MLNYRFAAPPPAVTTVLEKIRILGYFSVSGSREEALSKLAAEEPAELLAEL
jgi:hypothetical protein